MFALAVIFVASVSAHAHPGHDLLDHGAAHIVASPFHLLVLAASGIAFAFAAKFARGTHASVWLRCGATACLVLAAALAVLNR